MSFRAYQDNVVIELEPLATRTESGLELRPDGKAGAYAHRFAKVIRSGPGYHTPKGVFIPNEVKAGDRVVVSALAGQDFAMDLTVPRHNKSSQFQELFGERGEFRIVREDEILAVVEEHAA